MAMRTVHKQDKNTGRAKMTTQSFVPLAFMPNKPSLLPSSEFKIIVIFPVLFNPNSYLLVSLKS